MSTHIIPEDSIKINRAELMCNDNIYYTGIYLINEDNFYCFVDLTSPIQLFKFIQGRPLPHDSSKIISVTSCYIKLKKYGGEIPDVILPNKDTFDRVLKILENNSILNKLEHLIKNS